MTLIANSTHSNRRNQRAHAHLYTRQSGVSLVVVLLLLVIVSMLGIASMQIAMMGERGARNDRDMQIAWQSAEAALVDAETTLLIAARIRFRPSLKFPCPVVMLPQHGAASARRKPTGKTSRRGCWWISPEPMTARNQSRWEHIPAVLTRMQKMV